MWHILCLSCTDGIKVAEKPEKWRGEGIPIAFFQEKQFFSRKSGQ
jgi:hypothetical protein